MDLSGSEPFDQEPMKPGIKPHRRLLFLRVAVLAGLAAAIPAFAASAGSAFHYQNPVRAGDYPDPSVIRVGNEYWATATSSEWAPHFPILYSRDLVNWEVKQ